MDREPLRDTDAYMRVGSVSTLFPDENNPRGAASSFQELSQAFSQRITELQQLMCLRIEGMHCAFFFRGLASAVPRAAGVPT